MAYIRSSKEEISTRNSYMYEDKKAIANFQNSLKKWEEGIRKRLNSKDLQDVKTCELCGKDYIGTKCNSCED
jgi:hypothetical protein